MYPQYCFNLPAVIVIICNNPHVSIKLYNKTITYKVIYNNVQRLNLCKGRVTHFVRTLTTYSTARYAICFTL